MPIQTARAFSDPYTQADIPASASSVRRATWEQALSDLPGASLVRSFDLSFVRGIDAADKYSPAEASYYMEQLGLKDQFQFDRTYNVLELNMLASRKRAELRRMEILSRAEGSGSSAVGRFAIALASNLVDPLAIGSAFVPVVGQSRYAAMLERAGSAVGRAGVRAGVGAVEGAAGAAIVEPIIAGAKFQEQAEYSFADSFLNIAIGTAFGGGLHVAGGALGDRFRPQRQVAELQQIEAAHAAVPVMSEAEQALALRVKAAREELTQAHQDIYRQATEMIEREVATLKAVPTPDDARGWGTLESLLTEQRATVDSLATRIAADYEPAAIKAEVDRLTKDTEFVTGLRKKYRQRNVADRIAAQARENVTSRRTVLETKLAERRRELEKTQATVDQFRARNAADQRLEHIRVFRQTDDARKLLEVLPPEAAERLGARLKAATAEASALLESPEVRALTEKHPPASWVASQADPRTREVALRAAVAQAASGEAIEVRPVFDPSTMGDAGRRLTNPDERPLMDPKAVERADQVLAEGETADLAAIERETADLDAQVRSMLDEMGLGETDAAEFSPAVKADLEAADAAAAEAKQMAKASELLAACSVRHAA